MLIAKNKIIFFDNDDQFIDYCFKKTPSFYTSDKGNSYYDYDYTDDYKHWISLGNGFVIKDPKSLVCKRGCVNRGVVTKAVDNLYMINDDSCCEENDD